MSMKNMNLFDRFKGPKGKPAIPRKTVLTRAALAAALMFDVSCSKDNPGWTLGPVTDSGISDSAGSGSKPTASESDAYSSDSDGAQSSTTTSGTDSSTTIDLGTESSGTITSTSSETDSDTSTSSETSGAVCGDGIVDVGEACDDGNGKNTDACLDTCEEASCGDGYVEEGVEECDTEDTTVKCLEGCVKDPCSFYAEGLAITGTDKTLFCSEVTDVDGVCTCFDPTIKKDGANTVRVMVNSQFGEIQDLCDAIMPERIGSNETQGQEMCFGAYFRDQTNDFVAVNADYAWDGDGAACTGIYLVNTQITCAE